MKREATTLYKTSIACKVSPEEWDILDKYCEDYMLSKTEVLRMLIRSLAGKLKKNKSKP
jgi:hypothetical protein